MDSLNLKTLLEVVRSGSFSRAAERLYVTQSAVSRRIKCLEEEYGYPLLERTGNEVKLTGAGRLVIAKAQTILSLEETLMRQLETVGDVPRVNFACSHPFGIAHMPGILRRYLKKYGNLKDFKISFEMPFHALEGVQEGRFDLAVIEHLEFLDLTPFRSLPLPEDEMVFVSAPSLGLPTPMVTIDELVRQRLFRRKDDCCSWRYLALKMQMIGRDAGEFTKTVIYDDLHVIVESLVNGDGIALISKDLVMAQLSEGTLIEHRIDGFNHRRKRTLILNEACQPHPVVTDFIGCLCASFGWESFDAAALFQGKARTPARRVALVA